MNYDEVLKSVDISVLKDLTTKDYNIEKIRKTLEESPYNLSLTRYLIEKIVAEELNKKWDKGKKKWIDVNKEKSSENETENEVSKESSEFTDTNSEENDILTDANDDNKIGMGLLAKLKAPDLPNPPKPNKSPKKEQPILNNNKENGIYISENLKQETDLILAKLNIIEDKVNSMSRSLNSFKKDKIELEDKLGKIIKDFIRIYASEKSKKSVSINKKIKDLVVEYINKNYGIKDNDSLIINTALLLALYKNDSNTCID